MKKNQIDILILSYNRQKYFRLMIDSLHKFTRYPYRIIVADNGSSAEMQNYLKNLKHKNLISELILNEKNLFMAGWKYGLKFVKSEYFVLTDPDILVPDLTPCWLAQFVQCFEMFPDLSRLGMSLSNKNVPPCWNKYEAKFLTFKTGKVFSRKPMLRLSTPDTTLQMIKTNAFRQIEGFSQDIIDFSFLKRLNETGICAVHQDISGHHLGWDEYKDYPEYLIEKHNNLRPCREVDLIKK